MNTCLRHTPALSFAGLGALLLCLAACACSPLDACSKDRDCPSEHRCVRASAGWVESSHCVPLTTHCSDCADAPLDELEHSTDQSVSPDEDPDLELDDCSADCQASSLPAGTLRCLQSNPQTLCAVDCTDWGSLQDCNQDPSDGCEAQLASDTQNCGACRERCALANAVSACELGECRIDRCVDGFFDIDGELGNGCELHFETLRSLPLREALPAIDDVWSFSGHGARVALCARAAGQTRLGLCTLQGCQWLSVTACEQTQLSASLLFSLAEQSLSFFDVEAAAPTLLGTRFPFHIDNAFDHTRFRVIELDDAVFAALLAPTAWLAGHYWVAAGSMDPRCSGSASYMPCSVTSPLPAQSGLELLDAQLLQTQTGKQPLLVTFGSPGLRHARYERSTGALHWLELAAFSSETSQAISAHPSALLALPPSASEEAGFVLADPNTLTLFRYLRQPGALPHAFRWVASHTLTEALDLRGLAALDAKTLLFIANTSQRQSIFLAQSREASSQELVLTELWGEALDPHRPLLGLYFDPEEGQLWLLRGTEVVVFSVRWP